MVRVISEKLFSPPRSRHSSGEAVDKELAARAVEALSSLNSRRLEFSDYESSSDSHWDSEVDFDGDCPDNSTSEGLAKGEGNGRGTVSLGVDLFSHRDQLCGRLPAQLCSRSQRVRLCFSVKCTRSATGAQSRALFILCMHFVEGWEDLPGRLGTFRKDPVQRLPRAFCSASADGATREIRSNSRGATQKSVSCGEFTAYAMSCKLAGVCIRRESASCPG